MGINRHMTKARNLGNLAKVATVNDGNVTFSGQVLLQGGGTLLDSSTVRSITVDSSGEIIQTSSPDALLQALIFGG